MADSSPILLRYFAVRGRAQFIRLYLRAREVAFEDERVAIDSDFSAWNAIRTDPALSGPFSKLPVLHFGDRQVAEALVIQGFLHRVLGDEARLSADDNLRHAMLVSSLYCDVLMTIGILLWSEAMSPGVDFAVVAQRALGRLRSYFQTLERTLSEWRWLASAGARPTTIADCLLWDQLDVVEHVFGERALKLEEWEGLARFRAQFDGRHAGERLLAERPAPVTARPAEHDVIARIRSIVA